MKRFRSGFRPDELPKALPSLWRTFSIGYRAEPRLLVVSLGLALLMMLPDALLALWLKILVDGLVDDSRSTVIAAALALAASATATWYLGVLSQRVQRRFRDRIAIALESHVARLQASVPTIEHHERPEYLDRLAMLRDQVFTLDHLFMSLFSTMGWMFRLVIVAVLLASIHPVLALLLLCSVPAFYASTWRPAVEREVEESVISNTRLARHLFDLGTTAPAGKEVRVTNSGQWLTEHRREVWEDWYRPVARVRWGTAFWQSAVWAIFAAGYVGAIVYVTSVLDRGVGDVVLVVAAGTQLARYVGGTAGEMGFLRGFWLDASRRLTWLESYAESVETTATATAPERLREGLRFEHVSFRYPGTERLVLDDIDLFLPAGSVVAVVGENGAGKSTLIKLVSRMYAPTAGRITADGIDIGEMPTDQWRSRLAGAFQDFARFELHAQRTIGLGDLPRLDERAAASEAVGRAHADDVVERLEEGLDTQLGPSWDDGVEVSFGQWQKLALARGFMRDEPLLLILDEPTAALDAETEHALFEGFAEAARAQSGDGHLAILVSHRFSTVRMADLIVVMDGAKVVEFGSHQELMALGGQYAELFEIQAAAYR
ncbi:MAG: ABC transporter ATP-binding protein [Acidimicrobiales bacterium]|nr:ABC transporter ATP-binding protein [Acidimicrobiales bacterium]